MSSTSFAPETTQFNAQNLPIQLNFHSEPYLLEFQQKIEGNTKLHMTLSFVQLSKHLIQKEKNETIIQRIIKLPETTEMNSNIEMKFSHFGFIQPGILVAFFSPILKKERSDAYEQYHKWIQTIRDQVRQEATSTLLSTQENETTTSLLTSSRVVTRKIGDNEVCFVDGVAAYSMDIRDPLPHVTLKENAAESDLYILEQAQQEIAISSLPLDMKVLSAIPKRDVVIV